MTTRQSKRVILAAVAISLCPHSVFATANYAAVDLGKYPYDYRPHPAGISPRVIDVNNARQVVGITPVSPTAHHGFLWQDGTLTDLGAVDGPYLGVNSWACGIDDAGAIVGWSTGVGLPGSAFLWESGIMNRLSTDRAFLFAYAINSAGQIAGTGAEPGIPSQIRHARIWADGSLTTLPSLVTSPRDYERDDAWDINDAGRAAGRAFAGYFADPDNPFGGSVDKYHAVTWATDGSLTDLGPGSAAAVNELGQIVGYRAYDGAGFRPALWEPDGTAIELCTSGDCDAETARDFNELGQVVGGKFLWSDGLVFSIEDLLVSADGWSDFDLHAINDRGDIAGIATFQGEWCNVLLIAVPEPAIAGPLLLAALIVCRPRIAGR
jgi:probable HAF family extracellular repeat protein